MEEWICRQNIDRLRDRLTRASDQAERATLSRLLAEQVALLGRVSARKGPSTAENQDGASGAARR